MSRTTARKQGFSLIALLVVLMLSLSLGLAACTDNNNDSSSSSSTSASSATVADEHTLLNGNFEYYAEGNSITFPYRTSIRWTTSRGYIVSATSEDYAPSSDASSGIIDTSDDKYQTLLDVKFGDDTLRKYLSKDGVDWNPHSPSYYGYTEKDTAIPDTTENGGNRVLMIHNRLKNNAGQGTAQYFYTSGSTLSLPAGGHGKLTVWVNTFGLASEMNIDYGAYVKVVDRLNSNTTAPLIVKNINTDGQWSKIEIYLEGNELASSSYTLYLGLGLGSSRVAKEYVEGFAFFDDVTFDVLNEDDDDYAAELAAHNTEVKALRGTENVHAPLAVNADSVLELAEDNTENTTVVSLNNVTEKTNKTDDKESYTTTKCLIDFDPAPAAYDDFKIGSDGIDFNDEVFFDSDHKTAAQNSENVSVGYDTLANIKEKLSDDKAFNHGDDGDETYFGDSDKFVYFNYKKSSSYTVTSDPITVKPDGRVLITFWYKVKIENMSSNVTGLTVSVRDRGLAGAGTALSESEYKTTSAVTSKGDDNNNGWVKHTILISNTTKPIDTTPGVNCGYELDDVLAREYDIRFVFGPEGKLEQDLTLYPEGYALIGGVSVRNLTEDSAELFSASTSVTLQADVMNSEVKHEDNYTFDAGEAHIENAVLDNPSGGNIRPYNYDKITNSGIFNTEYYTHPDYDLTKLAKQDADNKYVQALLIGEAAGYYSTKSTVSAFSVAKVSVKLTTFGKATATVAVVNRNDMVDDHYSILTLAKDDIKQGHKDNYQGDALESDVQFLKTYTAAEADDALHNWHTITFYINAGNNDLDIGVEVWNGARFGTEATGIVVVDSISVQTSTSDTFSSLALAAKDENATVTYKTFRYRTDSYNEDDHEEPILVTVGDDTMTKFAWNPSTEDAFLKTVDAAKSKYYGLTLEYTLEGDEGSEDVYYANFLATNYIDKSYEAKPTDDADADTDADSTSSSESSASSYNGETVQWLQISSIVIAAVLIVVLLSVIIRFFVKKYRAKKNTVSSYYDTDARAKTNARIRSNKAKRELTTEEPDEDEAYSDEDEYDYDAASNIDESEAEEADAADAEEAAEEVAPEEVQEAPEAPEAPVDPEAPEALAEDENKDNN